MPQVLKRIAHFQDAPGLQLIELNPVFQEIAHCILISEVEGSNESIFDLHLHELEIEIILIAHFL